MKNIFLCFVIALLFVSFEVCAEESENIPIMEQKITCISPDISNQNLSTLVDGNNEFAFDMYNLLKKDNSNLFFSPYSVSLIMAMVYAGAKDETSAQIAKTMRYGSLQDNLHETFNFLSQTLSSRTYDEKTFSLKIVNDIWAQKDYSFCENFIDNLTMHYDSGLKMLDFISSSEQSRQTINEYINKKTNNLIKDLIPDGGITPFTRLVLTNAIYFKAHWQQMFDKNATFDGLFNLDDNMEVTVPMMSQKSFFNYARNSTCQAIELPYEGDNIVMTILLPNNLSAFEEKLNKDSLKEILDGMTFQKVKLQMPKFKLESSLNLKKVLCSLGMKIAFDPVKANFEGISSNENLYLQEILQKALVIVDEDGTEAAAATAAIFACSCMPMLIPFEEMIIDRPFIFFIIDKNTKSILFMGKILKP